MITAHTANPWRAQLASIGVCVGIAGCPGADAQDESASESQSADTADLESQGSAGTSECTEDTPGHCPPTATLSQDPLDLAIPVLSNGFAIGPAHTLLTDMSGAIRAWGDGDSFRMGDGRSRPAVHHDRHPDLDRAWARVSVARNHVCGLDDIGHLYCWGHSLTGAVGNGIFPDHTQDAIVATPLHIEPADHTWHMVAAGDKHTCGVDTRGRAWCWGSNAKGQLGNGGLSEVWAQAAPGRVEGPRFHSIAVAGDHTCGLTALDELWCWGDIWRSLGPSPVPTKMDFPQRFKDVRLGRNHGCGRDVDARMWCWGQNALGNLGVGNDPESSEVPLEVNGQGPWRALAVDHDSSCALDDDGKVWCWGVLGRSRDFVSTPEAFASDHEFVQVAVADFAEFNICGVDGEAAVYCYGGNASGQLGNGRSGARTNVNAFVRVGELDDPPSRDRVVDISVGDARCLVDDAGKVECWGHALQTASGPADGVCPVSDLSILQCPQVRARAALHIPEQPGTVVSAGWGLSCALTQAGQLWCWGPDSGPRSGNGDEDGDGDGDGDNKSNTPELVDPPMGLRWHRITAGTRSMCAIAAADGADLGSLWCWGGNEHGELGISPDSGIFFAEPQRISEREDWHTLGRGCAIAQDGKLWCWGINVDGRIGSGKLPADPQMPEVLPPTLVAGDHQWLEATVQNRMACGLTTKNKLYCWGSNYRGSLGVGQSDEALVASATPLELAGDRAWSSLAMVGSASCALDMDRGLWCWGSGYGGILGKDAFGNLNDEESRADHPVLVDPGPWRVARGDGATICGIRDADDRVACWGDGPLGDMGVHAFHTPRLVAAPE